VVYRNDGIGGTRRLTAARAVDPAPASAIDAALDPGDTVVAQAVRQARLDIAEHLPSARLGECRTCDVAAPCRPMLRSLVIRVLPWILRP